MVIERVNSFSLNISWEKKGFFFTELPPCSPTVIISSQSRHTCICFTDFSWWAPRDPFSVLYHRGNADSCANHPRGHYTAHVQFTDGIRDMACNQIKITVGDVSWKVGCHQVWKFSCSFCDRHCAVDL